MKWDELNVQNGAIMHNLHKHFCVKSDGDDMFQMDLKEFSVVVNFIKMYYEILLSYRPMNRPQ